jgi:hypothetical protein
MIINETDSGQFASRLDTDLKLIEVNSITYDWGGKKYVEKHYLRPHQALNLIATLQRLVEAFDEEIRA